MRKNYLSTGLLLWFTGLGGYVAAQPCNAPTNVTASPASVCTGDPSQLNATSSGNTIYWYTVPVGGVALGNSASGANFAVTPSSTTTYYAEALGAPTTTNQTFSYTGGMQTFTVPSGVTSITVDVKGAKGGGGYPVMSSGGLGGRVQGTLTVTPGQVLQIYVGGAGGNGTSTAGGAGGYNGGGQGAVYSNNYSGGGGGGASDIRVSPYALANRVAIAGGGGGGAYNYATSEYDRGGPGGGTTGGTGYGGNVQGGQGSGTGGTQAAGGTGGTYSGWCTATNGALGIGGAGGTCTNSGGGGGGGYYGGGGATWAGGGGGSSLLSGGTHTQGFQSGNGEVVITYTSGTGCTASARTPVTVTVGPLPNPSNAIATPGMICPGGSSDISATSGGTVIRWWDAPSGGNLLGTTNSGANFNVSPTTTTTYYAESSNQNAGSQTFNYTGSVANFTVPTGISSITIEARGAQGGNSNGGKGAQMIGTFAVTPGEVLGIAVGQQGIVNNCGGSGASGGGGGGTFAWRLSNTSVPIIVAGGGGGGNTNWSGGCVAGIDAVVTQNGTQGNGPTSAMGGTGGQGGFGNAPSGTGSGGCGWLSAGQNSTWGSGCTGGQGPFTFLGGNGASSFGPGGEGGFGGGGGAVCGCGGGGGYSGGGGGEGSSCRAGGGGGGSFNAGTNQTNVPGLQLGNGQLIITWTGSSCISASRIPVTVYVDTLAPAAVCQPVTVNLDSSGTGSITPSDVDNGSTDNCSLSSVTLSQSSFSCSDAGANTVILTVTDGNGNTSTCSTTVTVVGPPVVNNVSTTTTTCGFNISCGGGSDGIATASTSGGCPGYTYLWSNGNTSSVATGLSAGTYIVTVTDAAGTMTIDSVTLTAPAPVQVNPVTSNSCPGAATGSIDLTTSGGNTCQGAYSWAWDTGATTEDVTGVSGGNHTVTVTDGTGCTSVHTVTVAEFVVNPAINVSGNVLTSTQTWATYQWLLNGSNISGANAMSYTATVTGVYSLTVTDTNGCTATSDTIQVTIVGIGNPGGDWSDLSIFPNPTRGQFKLRTGAPISYGITVTIHDLAGRKLFEQSLPELSHEAVYDIHQFAPGTYMVEVVSEMGQHRLFRLSVQ